MPPLATRCKAELRLSPLESESSELELESEFESEPELVLEFELEFELELLELEFELELLVLELELELFELELELEFEFELELELEFEFEVPTVKLSTFLPAALHPSTNAKCATLTSCRQNPARNSNTHCPKSIDRWTRRPTHPSRRDSQHTSSVVCHSRSCKDS